MKKRKENKVTYNPKEIEAYRRLSAREKLKFLEETNSIMQKLMPRKSKKAWEELKKKGW